MIARHRLVALGLLWAFAVTLGRGLRQPNDWAEAHWLISYAFGPIKRGLPATLLRPFIAARPERAESAITIVATALTLSLCVVLVLLCWNLLRRANFSGNTVTTVAAFVTSPFVVMSGHLNGYFDAPIILLSILAMVLALRGRMWLAALALTIGLLIHETIVVIGFPVVVWAALLPPNRGEGDTTLRRLAPLALPAVAFAVLFLYQSYAVDAPTLESQLTDYLRTFPFIQYDQEVIVPRSFAKSFVAHFRSQSPRVWGRLFDPGLAAAILPTVLVLLLYAQSALRTGRARRGLTVAGLLLAFLPLSLHLIAWDTARIWTYPIVVALLAAWAAVAVADPTRLAVTGSRLLTGLGLLVLPFNVFGRIPLMDWRVERFSTEWRVVAYLPLVAALFLALARRRSTDYTQRDQFIVDRQ